MTCRPAYDRLEKIFDRLGRIDQALEILQWDAETLMPPGGASARAGQIAALKGLSHELLTAPDVRPLLDDAMGEDLDPWQRANLDGMRRDWLHAAAVPSQLVEELSLASSHAETMWRGARAAADFAPVTGPLGEVVRLTRELAAIKSQALGLSPYDAVLDAYEPGGSSAAIDGLFDDIGAFLPDFLARVLDRQPPAPAMPAGPFPEARQRQVCERIVEVLGFDFAHGRLDVSLHPFSCGGPDDVRITTRYDETDFLSSMMSVIHETGHALYSRGLPEMWKTQPVGRARSTSIHESQSLLMELQACRTPEFLSFAAPLIAEILGEEGGSGWDADTLRGQVLRVTPDFIRVDADEVTYPAHVILRYRLEKALIAGDLDVAGLPSAWNEGMEDLLGIRPPDDRLGCLQDIHWYCGLIGYFPTYTLGAMTAAQLFDAAKRSVPGLLEAIGQGDFRPLLGWLRTHVHNRGSLVGTDDLLTAATGRPLDSAVFKSHLTNRYLG